VKKPLQERSKDSTDQMLSAAFRLLDEGGLPAVTIAAVSEASGQSNGSIYHRFSSRLALIAATQASFLDGIESDARAAFDIAALEIDDRSALRVVAGSYVSMFSKHRRAFRALMIEGQDLEPLRGRGRETGHLIEGWAVAWFHERFGCSSEAAIGAVYFLLSAAVTRMVFDLDLIMAHRIDDAELTDRLVDALHALVR